MNLSSWRWYFYPRQYCSCWEGVRRGKHDCTGRLLSWVNPGASPFAAPTDHTRKCTLLSCLFSLQNSLHVHRVRYKRGMVRRESHAGVYRLIDTERGGGASGWPQGVRGRGPRAWPGWVSWPSVMSSPNSAVHEGELKVGKSDRVRYGCGRVCISGPDAHSQSGENDGMNSGLTKT